MIKKPKFKQKLWETMLINNDKFQHVFPPTAKPARIADYEQNPRRRKCINEQQGHVTKINT